jgi:AraC-like DNA-binding protein
MSFEFEQRTPISPYIETVWRTHSGPFDAFTSVAVSRWEIVVMRQHGRTTLTVRGPETAASPAACPGEAEFLGIQFKLGTVLAPFRPPAIVDRAISMPATAGRTWTLDGETREFPTFEDAELFAERLARQGLLARDPVVAAVVEHQRPRLSRRTIERHFADATGLTLGTVRQIARARRAAELIEEGGSIGEAVETAGFADQAHLTRALKRFVGQTPAQLRRRPQVRGL